MIVRSDRQRLIVEGRTERIIRIKPIAQPPSKNPHLLIASVGSTSLTVVTVQGSVYARPAKKKSFFLYRGPPTKPPKLLKRRTGFGGAPVVTCLLSHEYALSASLRINSKIEPLKF